MGEVFRDIREANQFALVYLNVIPKDNYTAVSINQQINMTLFSITFNKSQSGLPPMMIPNAQGDSLLTNFTLSSTTASSLYDDNGNQVGYQGAVSILNHLDDDSPFFLQVQWSNLSDFQNNIKNSTLKVFISK